MLYFSALVGISGGVGVAKPLCSALLGHSVAQKAQKTWASPAKLYGESLAIETALKH
jgi:hypothetical protein